MTFVVDVVVFDEEDEELDAGYTGAKPLFYSAFILFKYLYWLYFYYSISSFILFFVRLNEVFRKLNCSDCGKSEPLYEMLLFWLEISTDIT